MFSNIEIREEEVYGECDLWFTEQNADMLQNIKEPLKDIRL